MPPEEPPPAPESVAVGETNLESVAERESCSELPMTQRTYKGAEREARKLRDKKIGPMDVLAVLRKLPFAQNVMRKNVIPDGTPFIYSQCAGLTPSGLVSKLVNKCPEVVTVLVRFVNEAPELQSQKYAFTSITMNYNYNSKLHRDAMHIGGCSRIIALGDFRGGHLWLEDSGSVDIRNRWLDFDGRKLHKTEPHIGERYSLIYFAHEVCLRDDFDLRNSNSVNTEPDTVSGAAEALASLNLQEKMSQCSSDTGLATSAADLVANACASAPESSRSSSSSSNGHSEENSGSNTGSNANSNKRREDGDRKNKQKKSDKKQKNSKANIPIRQQLENLGMMWPQDCLFDTYNAQKALDV